MSSNRIKQKIHAFKEEKHLRGVVFFSEESNADYCWLIRNGEVEVASLLKHQLSE
jgi:hypothetical protein